MARRGFSLIEILLTLAAIGILAGMMAPVYLYFQNKNSQAAAINNIFAAVSRAEEQSRASDGDTTWGIKVQAGSVVVFKGASFAARDITYDESYDVSSGLLLSGTTEYVFTKVYGFPVAPGTITLTTPDQSIARNIVINAKGMISY